MDEIISRYMNEVSGKQQMKFRNGDRVKINRTMILTGKTKSEIGTIIGEGIRSDAILNENGVFKGNQQTDCYRIKWDDNGFVTLLPKVIKMELVDD